MDRRHNSFVSSDGSVESGWTVYLENSSLSSLFSRRIDDSFDVQKHEENDQELDLSMVSDASSGPQIFRENEVIFPENETTDRFRDTTTAGSLPKSARKGDDDRRWRRDRQEQTSSFLDDTASSNPNFNFNNSESSSCQNQFNTMRQSSLSAGNQRQKNQLRSQFKLL